MNEDDNSNFSASMIAMRSDYINTDENEYEKDNPSMETLLGRAEEDLEKLKALHKKDDTPWLRFLEKIGLPLSHRYYLEKAINKLEQAIKDSKENKNDDFLVYLYKQDLPLFCKSSKTYDEFKEFENKYTELDKEKFKTDDKYFMITVKTYMKIIKRPSNFKVVESKHFDLQKKIKDKNNQIQRREYEIKKLTDENRALKDNLHAFKLIIKRLDRRDKERDREIKERDKRDKERDRRDKERDKKLEILMRDRQAALYQGNDNNSKGSNTTSAYYRKNKMSSDKNSSQVEMQTNYTHSKQLLNNNTINTRIDQRNNRNITNNIVNNHVSVGCIPSRFDTK